MILISIRRHSDRSISGFTVTGHANFKPSGADIVCAGVSAVTTGTVNAIEALLHVDLQPVVKNGYLHAEVPEINDLVTFQQTQLLLESMMIMLQDIASSYATYITIKDTIQ